ncbi:hypothetical protein, partial [Sporisorium scitamineum]
MYIYGLKMNAYCVEWPEAPLHDNFERAEKRIAQQAQQYAAQQHLDTYVTTDDESIYRNEAPIAAPAAKPALKSALKKPSNAAAAGAAPAKKPATTAAAAST